MYEYSDPKRESEPHALPNVEVFNTFYAICGCGAELWSDALLTAVECPECGDWHRTSADGYYYAFGLPGCLWDGEPIGPFDTYDEALAAARGE